MIFVLLTVFFIDGLVDVFISGFIAQDPDGEEVITPKDGIFIYMKDYKAKIKKKITFMKKKFGKIEKHQFFTTFKVQKDFTPIVIGNFGKGFASLTLTKLLKKVQIAEKKAASGSASASPCSVSQADLGTSCCSRGLAEADGA
jgi:hypothetical protein